MKPRELFEGEHIAFEKVESLFAKMRGKTDAPVSPEELTLLDLPVIETHLASCTVCSNTLIELARKYGITRGVIYVGSSESKKKAAT